MTGTFSRLEERKSTETFRKSNGGKRVHSALQMEKEYRRKMVISFMDHNMSHSFGHVTLRYKMAAKSLKARLRGTSIRTGLKARLKGPVAGLVSSEGKKCRQQAHYKNLLFARVVLEKE